MCKLTRKEGEMVDSLQDILELETLSQAIACKIKSLHLSTKESEHLLALTALKLNLDCLNIETTHCRLRPYIHPLEIYEKPTAKFNKQNHSEGIQNLALDPENDNLDPL